MAQPAGDIRPITQRLGFGVSGPHGTALIRPETTIALITKAYHLGMRYFDTAPSYGAGEAERRLGEALAHLDCSDCVISTKAGVISVGVIGKQRNFSPQSIRMSLHASLKHLRRPRVDRFFLHGPAPSELTDELMETLIGLREKGDIGAIGICGVGKELDAAAATGEFAYYMTPIHAALSTAAIARLTRLREAGNLIGIETMALVKKKILPMHAGAIWRLARTVLGRSSASTAPSVSIDNALQWALAEGRADMVLTTTSRTSHLEYTAAAVDSIVRKP